MEDNVFNRSVGKLGRRLERTMMKMSKGEAAEQSSAAVKEIKKHPIDTTVDGRGLMRARIRVGMRMKEENRKD